MKESLLNLKDVPKKKRWVFIRNGLAIRIAKRHGEDLRALTLEEL